MSRITYIINARGNVSKNQLVILDGNKETFQSYQSIIAVKDGATVTLDPMFWDYSATTLKFLKLFLGVTYTKAEIQAKIDSGDYKTINLN